MNVVQCTATRTTTALQQCPIADNGMRSYYNKAFKRVKA